MTNEKLDNYAAPMTPERSRHYDDLVFTHLSNLTHGASIPQRDGEWTWANEGYWYRYFRVHVPGASGRRRRCYRVKLDEAVERMV